jgi:hypothetical protein
MLQNIYVLGAVKLPLIGLGTVFATISNMVLLNLAALL